MNEFSYLLRREIWEHRALYVVPLVFLGIIVTAVTFGIVRGTEYVGLSVVVRQLERFADTSAELGVFGVSQVVLFALFTIVVMAVYLLDALWADRKDRSILFWKSLPISDTHTVLSKLVTGTIVAPMISVSAAMLAVVLIMIVASVAIMLGGGNPFTLLWSQFPFFTLAYKAVAVWLLMALWFLPFTGWLMFASATARKTPFLFAALVPLGIVFVEEIAFKTHYFASALGDYASRFFETLAGDIERIGVVRSGDHLEIEGGLSQIGNLTGPLTDPVLLIGLAIGAGFVAATIYMRRHRVDAG